MFRFGHTPCTAPEFGRRVAAGTLVAAGLIAGVASAVPATAAPAGSPAAAGPAAVVTTVAAAEKAGAGAYWTPARMKAARSADLITVAPGTATPATSAVPTGPARSVPGTSPVMTPSVPIKLSGVDTKAGYTYVPTSASDYAKYPYRVNGKVFFNAAGSSWVCSGTSVSAFYNGVQQSEVWTAGHCLANSEGKNPYTWSSNVVFVPAYNGYGTSAATVAPYGNFPAIQSSVGNTWFSSGDVSRDLGAFKVGTSTTGQVLHQAVGAAGFAWNWARPQTFDMFGYPAGSPYNGTSMYHYRAVGSASVTWNGGAGQPLVGAANPMTGGSSGGAWYVQWASNYTGFINGHNDWKFDSSTMYSPYFDDHANAVRCFNASNC